MFARPGRTPPLSRRRFGQLLTFSGASLAWPWPLRAASARTDLSPALLVWLNEALPRQDSTYDPFAKMLVGAAHGASDYFSPGRSGDVHLTHASLSYAAALLETTERWRLDRAREILRAVLPLQDQDPESKTYGYWPWCLEESFTNLPATAAKTGDLCAAPLLMIWVANRRHLGPALETNVREAILHAAQSVLHHEVQLDRTHLAVLSTGIALVAAQELKLNDLRPHAKAQLRGLYDHIAQAGSFAEYNSPLDSLLTLQELSRALYLVRDAREKTLLTALSDLAWQHVATHFHPPTQQWAGPHSRARETNLAQQPAALAFLQKACGDQVRFAGVDPIALSLDTYRLPLACPRKWARSFASLKVAHEVVERFLPASPGTPGAHNPIVGTTWLHPGLALGSVNRADFWAQRRPLVAHWGTPNAPRFLRARFLKNEADFCSALLFSVQHQNHVLGLVVLATDHGDAHPASGPAPGRVLSARQLRLTFEFGGSLGRCTVRAAGDPSKSIIVQDEQVRLVLRPVADAFGAAMFRWDQPELSLAQRVNAVAHDGEEKAFDLQTLGEAFVCFTLSGWALEQKPSPPEAVQIQRSAGLIQARWVVAGKTLTLQAPTKPASFAELNDQLRSAVG